MYGCLIPKYKHIFKHYCFIIILKDKLLLSKMITKCINLEHNHQYNHSVRFLLILSYALTAGVHKYWATKILYSGTNIFCIIITILSLHTRTSISPNAPSKKRQTMVRFILWVLSTDLASCRPSGFKTWKLCAPQLTKIQKNIAVVSVILKANFICHKV